MGVKVSVIIPVYKVAKFVRRCCESLFNQTLSDVEYIFVDDASPDESIDIVKEEIAKFSSLAGRIKILTHAQNKGLAGARNTGLVEAVGEYIYHCDSDDWIETTMLEKMYNSARQNDSDIVYCDFYISFEKNERYMHNPEYSTADDLLRKGFLSGKTKYNVWNKLVRASIYKENDITFPTGHNMGEDMTMIQVAACSKNVSYVPEALYHYVKLNAGAYSNTMSEKHLIDIKYNMDRTISFLQGKYDDSISFELALFKLNAKLPFLITDDDSQYELWKKWYPESNTYAMKNPELPLRTRCIQWAAAHNLFLLVKLHYKLVYKLVYGILYR